MRLSDGVSFVVPVRNGASCLRDALASIERQADGRPMELLVVDDGSEDASADIVRDLASTSSIPIVLLQSDSRGAAAALNAALRAATYPFIAQVDQDVVLHDGWMRALLAALEDPTVGAAQGHYETARGADVFSRVMGLDLEQRYSAIGSRPQTTRTTTHVCTGNVLYRADALRQVGLFDDALGYGYDNDVSYRLQAAGYRLVLCREARSAHRWREGFAGYLRQQYGFGYGRLDVVWKHPRRAGGDSVSPAAMMAHPLLMAAAIAALAIAAALAAAGDRWQPAAVGAALVVSLLALERAAAGIAAARTYRDPAPLLFPIVHLARDLAWVAAIVVWCGRRGVGAAARPAHSMTPRVAIAPRDRGPRIDRLLALIPAHNEAGNLQAVVADLRACRPDLDILVVDDGSTDETMWLLEDLGVRWLRFSERLGVGSAIRAGLRYAARLGYDAVVRVDGDGQHRAEDIASLLEPIGRGEADVAVGSRYIRSAESLARHPSAESLALHRIVRRTLAACLSAQTGRRVTDPTSGFCALGRRAIRLLAEHHPTGYAEPELQLFLSRNALRVVEVAVHERRRLSGRTSLTAGRFAGAAARVLLALVIVPLRHRDVGLAGD